MAVGLGAVACLEYADVAEARQVVGEDGGAGLFAESPAFGADGGRHAVARSRACMGQGGMRCCRVGSHPGCQGSS